MAKAQSFNHAQLSAHAREQMTKRGIAEADIRSVLAAPGQVLPIREGRVVVQNKLAKDSLLRVFVTRRSL